MKPYLFITVILFLTTHLLGNKNIQKNTPPKWVKNITVLKDSIIEGNGSYQYLLLDRQYNIPQKEVYRHYAVKVLNSEGVQSQSRIDINFDPSYQKLSIHTVKIRRQNKIINKLKTSKIESFRREKGMERSLYDGSLSVVIDLTDVRENDIIEYSYTIKGFNPIYNGHFATDIYHQFSIPINRIHERILASSKHNIKYKKFNKAKSPIIKRSEKINEFVWDFEGLNPVVYDNNVPAWYGPEKRTSISTVKNWKEVVEWALPLYHFDKNSIKQIRDSIPDEISPEETILKFIRIVQDNVRYLGFESGIGAYKPNAPLKVFRQKYGDCKDKSLLLVALLRNEGVDAYPLLVNTELKHNLKKELPSLGAFNHCVVSFNYDGKTYYVDPTINNQGGNIETLYFPRYKQGLLIKPGEKGLIDIPKPQLPEIKIEEIFIVDSIGGSARLRISTEYTGSKADFIRNSFQVNSIASLQKDYLNFYSNLYKGIRATKNLEFLDYHRNFSNKVRVVENYIIDNFWSPSDDSSFIFCEIYPLVLETQTNFSQTTGRSMPYYLGEPYVYNQKTEVVLPENWIVQDSEYTKDGNGYEYRNAIKGKRNKVYVNHHYELKKEYLIGKSVPAFLEAHSQIRKNLSYQLTYTKSDPVNFKLSWISVLIVIAGLGLGIFFALKVYKEYNPNPLVLHPKQLAIGGWLVLPAIGLTLSPISIGIDLFTSSDFNHQSWNQLINSALQYPLSTVLFIGLEMFYNNLLFIFSILIVVIFYQKRTCAPQLITIFYTINFIIPLVDYGLTVVLFPAGSLGPFERQELIKEATRSFIAAAIWIPYFNISQRVKDTFCNQYGKTFEKQTVLPLVDEPNEPAANL